MNKIKKICMIFLLSILTFSIGININAKETKYRCFYELENKTVSVLGTHEYRVAIDGTKMYIEQTRGDGKVNFSSESSKVLNIANFSIGNKGKVSYPELKIRVCNPKGVPTTTYNGALFKTDTYNKNEQANKNWPAVLGDCYKNASVYNLKLIYCESESGVLTYPKTDTKPSTNSSSNTTTTKPSTNNNSNTTTTKPTTNNNSNTTGTKETSYTCVYEIENISANPVLKREYRIKIDNGKKTISTTGGTGSISFSSNNNDVFSNKGFDIDVNSKVKRPNILSLIVCNPDESKGTIFNGAIYKDDAAYTAALNGNPHKVNQWNNILGNCWKKADIYKLKFKYCQSASGVMTYPDDINNPIEGSVDVKVTSCGSLKDIPVSIPRITRNLFNAIKYLIPVALIFLGIFDFFQAMTSSDEKAMDGKKTKFIRRIIASLLIFFVMSIVQLVVKMIPSGDNTVSDITTCISCFISDSNSCGTVTNLSK